MTAIAAKFILALPRRVFAGLVARVAEADRRYRETRHIRDLDAARLDDVGLTRTPRGELARK